MSAFTNAAKETTTKKKMKSSKHPSFSDLEIVTTLNHRHKKN